ncbi:MAG: ABC transporter ATP-binding protein [Symbiobacteriia bacterium]
MSGGFGPGGPGRIASGGLGGPGRIFSGGPRGDRPKAELKDVPMRRVWALFWPYRYMFAAILSLALVGTILELIPPLLIRAIIDTAFPTHNVRLLLQMAELMVAIPAVDGLLGVLQNYLNVQAGQSIMRDLRISLFKNLQRQSMSFFTHSKAGEIIQRLMGDIYAVQTAVTSTIVSAVTQATTVIATAVIMLILDWRLALLSLAILPIFVLPVRAVGRLRRELRTRSQKAQGDMSVHLGEVFGVSGAMLIKIFGREPHEERRFAGLNGELMGLEVRGSLVGQWFLMMLGLLGPLGAALIYLYGGFGVLRGQLTVGDVVAFAAYLSRLYAPVSGLLNLGVTMSTSLGVFQRIFEYQDLEADVTDAPDAIALTHVEGHIRLEDVHFSYRADIEALRGVSFTVEPGQMVALVGPSGAGKSTLIQLVTRLYEPTNGRITIDGHDLRRVTQQSLREHISVVTQDPFLFHATVRENLLLAKPDATDAELAEACRKAYIHDLIAGLPEGYDTLVGERGYRFSGGERQRLSIARAILKDPTVLILDEATSHLDSQSEAYIQNALEELMQRRTTLVIAHRLSTVLAANKIVVLADGRVVEEGSHAELLERGGLYAKLYRTQFARRGAEQAEGTATTTPA